MTADGHPLSRRTTLLALSGVLLGMFVAALNQTIVAAVLPVIVDDIGGVEHYSWVFTAYMLGQTVSTPVVGRASDVYGRRPFLLAALLLFITGTILAGTAGAMTQLILARGIQGVASGALMSLALATIGDLVPPIDRGRWQGITGALLGVATVLGPAAGGVLADEAGWSWVFFASVPLSAIAFVTVARTLHVPPHPERDTRVDYTGAALLAAGLSSSLFALTSGGAVLWVAGGTMLVAFVWWERRVEQPLIPLELFRGQVFTAASLANFSVGSSMYCMIMFVPLYVQGVMGVSATGSGLILAPLMLALTGATLASGQLISRTGRYRWVLVAGPVIAGFGFVMLTMLTAESTRAGVTAAMIVGGLGLGLLTQNLVLVVQNAVPRRHMGIATGAGKFCRSLGGTIGVSAMGAILAAGLSGGPASPERLADALHPLFVLGIPLMALTLALVLLIPEIPMSRTFQDEARREAGAQGTIAA